MDDVNIQDGLGRVRRTRGPTRARDVWSLHEDEKIVKSFLLPKESHDWVLKSVNRKWKEYRAKLKADWKHDERVGESLSSYATSHIEAQVLAELLGLERYGRVRGYGVGVTPTQLSAVGMYTRNAGEGSSNAEVSRLRATIEDMKDHHQAELAELKQNQQTLQYQLEHISSMLQRYLPPQIPDTSTVRRDGDGAESGP
ncbi:uncharacterized protein LOC120111409 [Phoenix dactylifera]|uniref:Uncharacterized protein LOC120111409 n=1 Tax=Phoenix dactylifera TaxID=42345 RepID=A0A8B9AK43_PHODC|nr:uncharacterized protein LOC120111409 [Phoenix dactylifera]